MSSNPTADRRRQMALRLLRFYPRPWRVRYQREMQALLQDMPVGWRHVANLASGALREWLSPRALGWPARSAAGRLWTFRLVAFLAIGYSLDGVARLTAARLASARIEFSDNLQFAIALVGLALGFRVLLAAIVTLRPWAPRLRRHRRLFQFREWEVVLWTILIWPMMLAFYLETPPDYLTDTMIRLRPYLHFIQIYTWAWMLFFASARTQRLQSVQSSFLKRRLQPRSVTN